MDYASCDTSLPCSRQRSFCAIAKQAHLATRRCTQDRRSCYTEINDSDYHALPAAAMILRQRNTAMACPSTVNTYLKLSTQPGHNKQWKWMYSMHQCWPVAPLLANDQRKHNWTLWYETEWSCCTGSETSLVLKSEIKPCNMVHIPLFKQTTLKLTPLCLHRKDMSNCL